MDVGSVRERDGVRRRLPAAERLRRRTHSPHDSDNKEPFIEGSYESLDYELIHSQCNISNRLIVSSYGSVRVQLMRVVVCFMIAVFTAGCASALTMALDATSNFKFGIIRKYMYHCEDWQCVVYPFSIWLLFNVAFAVLAYITAYVEPVSIGSGIPQIKCYLNGVKIPRCVRLKTLFMKLLGVYGSVMAGLPVGKEGPMIHSGAVIAAGLSQGKSSTLRFNTPFFQCFREDHEKRDFVACGSAAGVAAAFGAPGGGALFAIEEGASYLHQDLLFRLLFAAFVAAFLLKQILSSYYGHPGEVMFSGLLDFGSFEPLRLTALGFELLAYGLMAVGLGLLGALFVSLNIRISKFRRRYVTGKWLRGAEVVLVSICMMLLSMSAIVLSGEYRYYGADPQFYPYKCRIGSNRLAISDLLLQTPEATLRSLLHNQPGSFGLAPLLLITPMYFIATVWTYGLPVPSGVFIPSLVTGALIARTLAALLLYANPSWSWWIDPGKFALFGGAAMLGGVVRMAISLTFIILEAVGVISIGPLLMAVLIIAKYTADCFNESLYDAHINLDGIPLLSWRPPPDSESISITQVMSRPVQCVRMREKAGYLYDLLDSCTHSGFPVVDDDDEYYQEGCERQLLGRCDSDCSDEAANHLHVAATVGEQLRQEAEGAAQAGYSDQQVVTFRTQQFGRFRGFILRSQIVELLKYKLYSELLADNPEMGTALFNCDYPRYPSHKEVHVSVHERELTADLSHYMNPACLAVLYSGNLPRVFELFRALGLRHCVVINDRNQVIGIVTRKDLCRYRVEGPIYDRRLLRIAIRRPPVPTPSTLPPSSPPPSGRHQLRQCRHLRAARFTSQQEMCQQI